MSRSQDLYRAKLTTAAQAVEAFVTADPYVRHGLVTQWRVRPWPTVVDEDASAPVHVGEHGAQPCSGH
jgi:hypothetical protein